MPPPKPPQELTQLEVQLLMTAARLLAATRTFSPRPPPHAQEAYLMNKVKEEIMSVANNFKKFVAEPNKNLKKPRVHPLIQVMSREWKKAEEESRMPDWSIFTTDYISGFCANQRANEPDWHSDLSSLDLGPYMEGLQDHRRWWEVGLPATQDDEDVPMDPPASLPLPRPPRPTAVPPTTAPPSTPIPQAATHSSKGKACALPPAGSSDPRGAPPASPAPPAPLPAPAPSTTPAAPYAFRGPRQDFDTTPRKRGGPPDASLPQVHVDDASPPPPAQRRRTEVQPPVATGNDRCGPCKVPKNNRPQCIAQTNPKHLTFVCTFCAGRRKHCTPPASWAAQWFALCHPKVVSFALWAVTISATDIICAGVALPEEVQDTLNVSDEGGSSHHSPMSLRSPSGTPGEDLASRVNSLEGKMDYVILVLNAIAGRQGIVPSTLPGYIQPPPPRRSPSPSTQSQSSPGIPISSLGISDPLTNTPSGSGSASDRSVHRGRGGASPASRGQAQALGVQGHLCPAGHSASLCNVKYE
ncbi:hypothetical protein EI94DRAFT_1707798 [Lactarius quietus]|nr:hypothetical protein EI94DRAFT_1707798 [Lactarius quietus]